MSKDKYPSIFLPQMEAIVVVRWPATVKAKEKDSRQKEKDSRQKEKPNSKKEKPHGKRKRLKAKRITSRQKE